MKRYLVLLLFVASSTYLNAQNVSEEMKVKTGSDVTKSLE